MSVLCHRCETLRSQVLSCVEIAIAEDAVHVRDSKDLARPPFAVTREEWAPFVRFVADS